MKSWIFILGLIGYSASVLGVESVAPYTQYMRQLSNSGRAVVNKMVGATALINYGKDNCSGVFVSSEGHMLTALHCLNVEGMTDRIFRMRREAGATLAFSRSGYEGGTLNLPVAVPTGNPNNIHKESVELLFMGEAWPARIPHPASASKAATNYMRENMEDFALIKLERLPPGYNCVNIASQLPAEGELIMLTGYPKARRTEYTVIKGDESAMRNWEMQWRSGDLKALHMRYPEFLSMGRFYNTYSSMLRALPQIGEVGISEAVTDPEIYFATSSPSVGGMSGGGGFNSQGRLIGITSMKIMSSAAKYIEGKAPDKRIGTDGTEFSYSTSMVRIDHIKSRLRSTIGSRATERAFNCR